jgi:hypothetical protein
MVTAHYSGAASKNYALIPVMTVVVTMMVVGVIGVQMTVMVVAIVMMVIVTIVMMVVTMAVPSCGWSRTADCDCANYAQCCSDLP